MTCPYDFRWRHIYVKWTITSGTIAIYWILKIRFFLSVITSPIFDFFSKVRLIPHSARSDLSKEQIKSGTCVKVQKKSLPWKQVPSVRCTITMWFIVCLGRLYFGWRFGAAICRTSKKSRWRCCSIQHVKICDLICLKKRFAIVLFSIQSHKKRIGHLYDIENLRSNYFKFNSPTSYKLSHF